MVTTDERGMGLRVNITAHFSTSKRLSFGEPAESELTLNHSVCLVYYVRSTTLSRWNVINEDSFAGGALCSPAVRQWQSD